MSRFLVVSRLLRHRTRVRVVGLGVVLAIAFSVGLAPRGAADTAGEKRRLDANIAAQRDSLEHTSKNLANAFDELRRTKLAQPRALGALAVAGAARVAADRHANQVAITLETAQANEVRAADTLARNALAIQGVHDQVGNLVRNDYQRGGDSGLSIALGAITPDELASRIVMMDTVLRVRRTKLRELDIMRAQAQAQAARLVAVRKQVVTLKVQAEASLAQATMARATAAAAKARLDVLYAAQSRYAATVAARKAEETSELRKMQAESDSLTRALAARARSAREAAARAASRTVDRAPGGTSSRDRAPGGSSSSDSAKQSSRGGFLSLPSSAPVSSEFGWRMHPIWGISLLHAGTDFAAACGSPVRAAADGDMVMATSESASGGYGNRLVIDHGLRRGVDLTTTYNHLTSFVVTAGHVTRGQLVAYSGTTGNSTGCHLHFETRADGSPVNPRDWL